MLLGAPEDATRQGERSEEKARKEGRKHAEAGAGGGNLTPRRACSATQRRPFGRV